jgi:hypothetical protein
MAERYWRMKSSLKLQRSSDSPAAALAIDAPATEVAAHTRLLSLNTLPHEWAFGSFLLLMSLRLALHGNAGTYVLLFATAFATCIAAAVWTDAHPSPTRWRVRLLWYPSAMGIAFYALSGAIGVLGSANADGLLDALDLRWLGAPAAAYFAGFESPALTDLLTIAYLFFFWYLIAGPAHYCLHDLPRLRSNFAGLFVLYAIGFLGYTIVPAAGPHLNGTLSSFPPTGPLSSRLLPFINTASNGIDAFPSIHVAVSLYLLLFDARHYRQRFARMLVPCLLLWVSTLYLRYHYLVDVVAGAALGCFGFLVALLYEGSALAATVEAQAAKLE